MPLAFLSTEAATGGVLRKTMFLKISQNFQETPVPESLFYKGFRPQACNFIKRETLAQVFSCEFCEIFKNIYFQEHL